MTDFWVGVLIGTSFGLWLGFVLFFLDWRHERRMRK